jgi:glycosyltransferase involved in cell wall biosynthesis
MNVGIVSKWWNRGQGTVSRLVRTIFDEHDHDTFVLARPTADKHHKPRFVDTSGVWDQPNVTIASNNAIAADEYLDWAKQHSIEVVFFDQNTQYDEIETLRRSGVVTVGRFVWERFRESEVPRAKAAFDIIYSMIECEQARYASFGIDAPRVHWGIHDELLSLAPKRSSDEIAFFFQGGFLGGRKPVRSVVEAFQMVDAPHLRLVLKTQGTRKESEVIDTSGDPRIELITADLPADEYYRLFHSCHVNLAPSRAEGLGVHFYEAIAFGMPIITNDDPPMNETVRDGYNGLLVKSRHEGKMASGIPRYEPDVEDMARAIRALSDFAVLEEMAENTLELRREFSWETTTADYLALLDRAVTVSRDREAAR